MSGCKWERTSSYIANNDSNLKKYGESLTYDEEKLKKESTKYTMVYPNNESGETNINTAIQKKLCK